MQEAGDEAGAMHLECHDMTCTGTLVCLHAAIPRAKFRFFIHWHGLDVFSRIPEQERRDIMPILIYADFSVNALIQRFYITKPQLASS